MLDVDTVDQVFEMLKLGGDATYEKFANLESFQFGKLHRGHFGPCVEKFGNRMKQLVLNI